MPEPADQIVSQIDTVINLYNPHLASANYGWYIEGSEPFAQEAQSRIVAAIHRYTLSDDPYRAEVDRIHGVGRTTRWRAAQLLGVLTALRDDYRAGNMATVQELIHADLFADFLEMADELQRKGFKDPAAVLTGSVLEEHLRKLAQKAGIPTADEDGGPFKAERINTELSKGVYDKNEQKQVTAWLGMRNSAAHGEYDDYDYPQVALMIQGVRAFLIRRKA